MLACWQLLVEVDHLKNISTPYIQIKGSNKEAVAAAGLALNLEGSYTTMVRTENPLYRFLQYFLWVFLVLLRKKAPFSSCSSSELNFTVLLFDQPYIEIILDNGGESNGVEDPQAARLQELVDYVQAQVSVFRCSATIVICATFMFVALWIYYFPTNCISVQTA